MEFLHKKMRRYILFFAALTLVMALLTAPACATATRLDPTRECSITLSVNNLEPANASEGSSISAALEKLNFKADIWLVATVDDDVNYTLVDQFDNGIKVQGYTLDDLNSYKKSAEEPELNKKAELAASIYGAAKGIKSGAPEEEPSHPIDPDHTIDMINGSGSIDGLQAGYYLVVPQDVFDNEYAYTFAPSLVAIPYPGIVGASAPAGEDPAEAPSEGYEDWIYTVNAKLKPEREMRRGDAVIHKHLTGYNQTLKGADFVFTVEGKKDGQLVYSNVITFHFDGSTYDKEYVIHDLPLGTELTVTEAYTGSCYALVSENDLTDVVIATDELEPEKTAIVFYFTNSPTHETSKGTSVLNHYSEGTDGNYGHTNEFTDSTHEPTQNN